MSVKVLTIGMGLAAAIAVPGLAVAEVPNQPPLTVFHAPHPQDPPPTASLPSAEQLTGILDNLVDPRVPAEVKSGLVAGAYSGTRPMCWTISCADWGTTMAFR